VAGKCEGMAEGATSSLNMPPSHPERKYVTKSILRDGSMKSPPLRATATVTFTALR